jgi:alcohol dehydrogenase class IV
MLAPDRVSLSVAATGSDALDFTADLDALTTRVLPSLSDAAAADALGLRIADLSAALDAGDKAEAARAVAATRALLTSEIGAWGDLGAIELVLNNVERALQ